LRATLLLRRSYLLALHFYPAVSTYLEELLAQDREKAVREVETLFEEVAQKYGDLKGADGTPLKERAGAELFEIRNLRVGKEAPEIEGEDQDGRRLKLSDYRGKVVLLDFWSQY